MWRARLIQFCHWWTLFVPIAYISHIQNSYSVKFNSGVECFFLSLWTNIQHFNGMCFIIATKMASYGKFQCNEKWKKHSSIDVDSLNNLHFQCKLNCFFSVCFIWFDFAIFCYLIAFYVIKVKLNWFSSAKLCVCYMCAGSFCRKKRFIRFN